MLFLYYPNCITCQNAKKWLDQNEIEYTLRDIKLDKPNCDEIKEWHQKSGIPLKRFFNSSGLIYKDLKLKDVVPTLSEQEQIELLSTNGMLVKRPVLVGEDFTLIGFRPLIWEEKFL